MTKAGVSYATVSAVTSKAQIRYDSERVHREDIIASIAQLGYRTELLPDSATDARLRVALNGGLAALPSLRAVDGVSSAQQAGTGGPLIIDYDPTTIGPRSLLQIVRSSAPQAQLLKGSSSAQQEAATEIAKWRRHLLLAFLLSLPCMFLAYIVPLIPTLRHVFQRQLVTGVAYGTLISWAFSTPVQFVLGAPLYVSAYRGIIYVRQANMDLLVMLSTTTAYGYSFVSCLVAFATSDSSIGACRYCVIRLTIGFVAARNFFETSAILLTLILLGRYLEILAKGRTSDVLSRVQQMQATSAVLVLDNGAEEHIPAELVQRGDLLKVCLCALRLSHFFIIIIMTGSAG